MNPRRHEAVTHPRDLLVPERQRVGRLNEWAATHLAAVFGAVWTVWAFFVSPLLVQLLPAAVQSHFSYYAQSWVQLFALPLFVWVGNRLQKSADAQSDAQHAALTHIANTVDEIKAAAEAGKDGTP